MTISCDFVQVEPSNKLHIVHLACVCRSNLCSTPNVPHHSSKLQLCFCGCWRSLWDFYDSMGAVSTLLVYWTKD